MRVLFVSHTYVTPESQKKLDLLALRGVIVGLAAPNHWKPVDGLFAGQIMNLRTGYDSFDVIGVKVIRAGHIASYVFSPLSLWRAIRKFNPDIIHVEQEIYSLASAQVALYARLLRKRLVVFGWENLDRPIHPLQRLARSIVIREADAIICGNNDGARLARAWGFERVVEVMPQLGVDLTEFTPRAKKRQGGFRIGFLGRLVPEKGVDVLLRSLHALVQDRFDVEATICGSGPSRGDLEALAEDLSLMGRIKWLDAVPHEDVPDVLSAIDVLVLPSRVTARWKEQFGLVLAQAMAMGTPVLGSESGAIPELIGRSDVLFPQNDFERLARLLRRLVEQPAWRDELAEYGVTRAKMHFGVDAIADRLADFYLSLLGVKQLRPSPDPAATHEAGDSSL
jgi:glycosyltransferase involved in cell wall biosynthesis